MSLPVKKTEATKIIILVFIVNKGHYLSQCGGPFNFNFNGFDCILM